MHPPHWILNLEWALTGSTNNYNCSITGFVDKELVRDLLTECSRMCKFDHPNVLKLSGVCLDGGPAPYIIMPYMENGSLNTYLKNQRESYLLVPETAEPDDVVSVYQPCLMDIVQFCLKMPRCQWRRSFWICAYKLLKEWSILLARESFTETWLPETACKFLCWTHECYWVLWL